jgi:hypothetical protein
VGPKRKTIVGLLFNPLCVVPRDFSFTPLYFVFMSSLLFTLPPPATKAVLAVFGSHLSFFYS